MNEKELPYFVAYFQGKGLTVNCEIDIHPEDEKKRPYIKVIWIKSRFPKGEWLINLEKESIKYKKGSQRHTKAFQRDRSEPGIVKTLKDKHWVYEIDIPLATIKVIGDNRQLLFDFKSLFFKKFGSFKNCIGAIISKKHFRYLSHLKQIK